MISTNSIFESAHGPEIPNFLEIVAGYDENCILFLAGRSDCEGYWIIWKLLSAGIHYCDYITEKVNRSEY